ncbi:hypothetical protein NF98_11650 [Salmonella enterica subsp. enterica serovar Rubislaw]|nr:hypothetical protein [Salmonella enterica]EBL5122377.1 hypothetical protein [Salmonella enterica subsp. enterica serovar Rubislaw]
MMTYDMIIIALFAIAGIPAIIGLMSFITWENGFRVLGVGYICRMTLVFIVLVWIIYLIPGGEK